MRLLTDVLDALLLVAFVALILTWTGCGAARAQAQRGHRQGASARDLPRRHRGRL